jgi:hypothetical protein
MSSFSNDHVDAGQFEAMAPKAAGPLLRLPQNVSPTFETIMGHRRSPFSPSKYELLECAGACSYENCCHKLCCQSSKSSIISVQRIAPSIRQGNMIENYGFANPAPIVSVPKASAEYMATRLAQKQDSLYDQLVKWELKSKAKLPTPWIGLRMPNTPLRHKMMEAQEFRLVVTNMTWVKDALKNEWSVFLPAVLFDDMWRDPLNDYKTTEHWDPSETSKRPMKDTPIVYLRTIWIQPVLKRKGSASTALALQGRKWVASLSLQGQDFKGLAMNASNQSSHYVSLKDSTKISSLNGVLLTDAMCFTDASGGNRPFKVFADDPRMCIIEQCNTWKKYPWATVCARHGIPASIEEDLLDDAHNYVTLHAQSDDPNQAAYAHTILSYWVVYFLLPLWKQDHTLDQLESPKSDILWQSHKPNEIRVRHAYLKAQWTACQDFMYKVDTSFDMSKGLTLSIRASTISGSDDKVLADDLPSLEFHMRFVYHCIKELMV